MCFERSFKQFLCLAILLAGLVGCDSSNEVSSVGEEKPYRVVTTVGMITDIASEVAGERATVDGLIGQGVDPHLYKPTRSDVVALSEADVVFYNGLLLEGKMTEILERVAKTEKPVRAVTAEILNTPEYLLNKEESPEYTDPHVWMDVSGWIKAVSVVAETLAAYDSEYAQAYLKRAEDYKAELKRLDAYARSVMATIPDSQRVLVTAHDAFRYLGKAYGIEVRGIQGVSTESEAGLRDLEDLVDFIVERKIPSVFVESSVADKNVRALVEGARSRGHEVSIGGELFSDAMGAAGSYEGTYIGMIDYNVTTIANALGGSAPGLANWSE